MEGCTAIHIACSMGKNDILKILYKFGADVKIANKNGITGIHIASLNNHVFCLTFLVEKGADIDQKDSKGETALQKASQMGNDDIIYYVLAWTKNLDS